MQTQIALQLRDANSAERKLVLVSDAAASLDGEHRTADEHGVLEKPFIDAPPSRCLCHCILCWAEDRRMARLCAFGTTCLHKHRTEHAGWQPLQCKSVIIMLSATT
eukprot:TRINITY_DN19199_c0_g1_i1.p2 TRINITY_DN19199_c0_g1~~TRINITY_DN19199_c0_g1_i1.p2  ORF type:complete len:106 (-),score=16.20 TRINITY_DN19199_c0_g1_i1:607-924(-)